MSTTTKVDRIAELGSFVRDRIDAIFADATDQITEAINVAVENAQESETEGKEAVVSLPIAVKWNLDTNAVEVALAVKVTHKFTAEGELVDHNQPALPLVDADGDPIPDRTNRAVKAIETVLNKRGVGFSTGATVTISAASEFAHKGGGK